MESVDDNNHNLVLRPILKLGLFVYSGLETLVT